MQQIFSAIRRTFHKSALILGLLSLIVSSLFIFQQPTAAAAISTEGQKLTQQEQMDKGSETANLRQQNYEEEVKAAQDPGKAYEKSLKENPGPGLVDKAVQGAEKLVDKVRGKE